VEVTAEENHALVIVITRVTNDPNYSAYRMGQKKIVQKVSEL